MFSIDEMLVQGKVGQALGHNNAGSCAARESCLPDPHTLGRVPPGLNRWEIVLLSANKPGIAHVNVVKHPILQAAIYDSTPTSTSAAKHTQMEWKQILVILRTGQ